MKYRINILNTVTSIFDTYVAEVFVGNSEIPFRVGPAYNIPELIQMILEKFGV